MTPNDLTRCPYCQKFAPCVDSVAVYGRSYGMIYYCRPCDAYVGCHPGTQLPKGTLAKKPLREARKRAHAAFDLLWQSGEMQSRTSAYKWLAREMRMKREDCHIGLMDEEQCRRVVEHVKFYAANPVTRQYAAEFLSRPRERRYRSEAVREFLGPTLEDHLDEMIGHKHGLHFFEEGPFADGDDDENY